METAMTAWPLQSAVVKKTAQPGCVEWVKYDGRKGKMNVHGIRDGNVETARGVGTYFCKEGSGAWGGACVREPNW